MANVICGGDKAKIHNNDTSSGIIPSIYPDKINREALNEVLTDFLAMSIEEEMKKDGLLIKNDFGFKTLYSEAFPYLTKFIKKNWGVIKNAYMSEDKTILQKEIGKENFKELCNKLSYFLNINTSTLNVQDFTHFMVSKNRFNNSEDWATNFFDETINKIENYMSQDETSIDL